MVYIHGFHDEIHLIHMFRVANSCYDFRAAQLFCKGSDNYILLVAVSAGDEKIKVFNAAILEQTYLLGITGYCHNIVLLTDFIEYGLVCIKYSQGVISTHQSIDYLQTQFSGSNDCNFHSFIYLAIIVDVHFILPHYIKFASMAVLL